MGLFSSTIMKRQPHHGTLGPILCFLIKASAIIHVFPNIIHFFYPHPLSATVPLLFESIVSVYCLEYLSTHCPIFFTPLRLHVPLYLQNFSCQKCSGPPHFKSSDEPPVLTLFILPAGVDPAAPALFLEIIFFTWLP